MKFAQLHYFWSHNVGRDKKFYVPPVQKLGGRVPPSPHKLRTCFGGPKSHSNVISTFLKTVHLLAKDLRFEHGGAKLVSFPRRHPTSLRPCTSRWSSQNGEICLQKYLPISGKLSITNYLKQNGVDYRSHLTIENNLKVERKVHYFENKHNIPSPQTRGLRYA